MLPVSFPGTLPLLWFRADLTSVRWLMSTPPSTELGRALDISWDTRQAREMVPGTGLEPAHLAVHGPKPCASANSAIRASCFIVTPQAEDS